MAKTPVKKPPLEVCLESTAQALDTAVHFSFKTTNSNIAGGGIRLSQDQAINLPYLSARTLLADGINIPVDYFSGATAAGAFKAIKAAVLHDEDSGVSAEAMQQVQHLLTSLAKTPFSAGTDVVSMRMRQILIPLDSAEQYVSFSPLTAAGLCALINREVDSHNQAVKVHNTTAQADDRLRRLNTAHLGIGGSNPQNVGAWVRDMQRPLFVGAPKNNTDLRHAMKVFYHGFKWYVASDLMQQYAALINEAFSRAAEKTLTQDEKSQTMQARLDEMKIIQRITRHIRAQGEEKQQLLKLFETKLPSLEQLPRRSFWMSDQVAVQTRGLLEPNQRDEAWKDALSDEIAAYLCNALVKLPDGHSVRMLSMDGYAHSFLYRKIKQELSTWHG